MTRASQGLFACVLLSASLSAHAWWDQGHQLVAEIAQDAVDSNHTPFLSPTAKASIQTLLQVPIAIPGNTTLSQNTNTLTKSASWADSIKSYYTQGDTYAACHFSDVPVEQLTFQILPNDAYTRVSQFYTQNLKTYNSISCMKSAVKTLLEPTATDVEKAVALRMVTHIVGDIGQPLHSSEYNSDKGGNNLILKTPIAVTNTAGTQSNVSNMHSLWDSTLGYFPQYIYNTNNFKNGIFSDSDVNSVIEESKIMVNKQDLKDLPVNSYESDPVSVVNWVADSYLAAQNVVYYNLPLTGTQTTKGYPYVSISTSSTYFQNSHYVLEPLMYSSGVHLAKLLTAIFDPAHAEAGYISMLNEIHCDSNVSTFPPR